MENLKRRYVYEETYNEIMGWGKRKQIRSLNNKANFPFFLNEYIKELKG